MSDRYAVLVTGGRDYDDAVRIREVIRTLPEDTLIFNGQARGTDRLADVIARQEGYPTAGMPFFTWLGKGGGFPRNQLMVDVVKSLEDAGWKVKVVAFPGGNGTKDCIQRAKEAGLPVQKVS